MVYFLTNAYDFEDQFVYSLKEKDINDASLQKGTYLKVNNPVVNSSFKSLIKVVSWWTTIQTNCTKMLNINFTIIIKNTHR